MISPQDVCEQYLSERVLSDLYASQIKKISGKLSEFSAKAVNAYLKVRLEKVSPTTVCNERRIIRTLWSYAYDHHLTDTPPRAVLKIRPPSKVVKAWTVADLKRLVNSVRPYHGRKFVCGVDKGVWLEAWIRIAYDSGARYGDIFSWTTDNIRAGHVEWVTEKTGVVCVRKLKPETRLAVGELLQERRRANAENGRKMPLLGGLCCRRHSFKVLRCVLDAAGLDGSGKWLRRSAATHVEQQRAGAGQRFLGHRSPGMAERHYLDKSQLEEDLPMPWPLLIGE